MIFKTLTVTDFRAFSGRNELDLQPRNDHDENRPIVLVGGLNGAGKTSTLMAIRVAVHGRQSLGAGTSTKAYHTFLKSCIHRNSTSIIKCRQASLELIFEFAHMGTLSQYRVTRTWAVESAGSITESLNLTRDGKPLPELNYEQCQSFLNEMVPPGIADLFLFDGEKISELAEDSNGTALSESLKKIIGVDLLETLRADLKATQRRALKRGASDELTKDIEALEKTLIEHEEAIGTSRTRLAELTSELNRLAYHKDKKNNEMLSRGGAWAEEREAGLLKESSLRTELEIIEKRLRDILGSVFPISLAESYCKKVAARIESEHELQLQKDFELAYKNKRKMVDQELMDKLSHKNYQLVNSLLDNTFLEKNATPYNLVHDVTPTQVANFTASVGRATNERQEATILAAKITKLYSQLEMTERNIARAPDEDLTMTLKLEFDELLNQEVELRTQVVTEKENIRNLANKAITTTLELRKLSAELNASSEDARLVDLCDKSVALLSDFAIGVTKRKIAKLENSFCDSYKRLARKKMSIPKPRIDPYSFSVSLLDSDDTEIDKNEMSAGEKQIYAIAMLDALGKITGKSIPIIIDTPLGRLDSKHRDNIIENYFPFASHQVIILSTDTEIHKSYQSKLEKYISHSIKLEYSEETKSTVISEGYFWEDESEAIAI